MQILVFDIETIPDVQAGRKLYNLEGLSDIDTAKAMFTLKRIKSGNTFLAHHLQKIVAISIVYRDREMLKIWSLGELNSNEPELIQRFYNGIDKFKPTLVSWNGGGFDLPVLHYRALLHKISAPRYWDNGNNNREFRYNNYLSRYHYRHMDIMDIISGYQPRAVAPLDEIATMLGFPGKMGMSGDKVWDEYLSGNLQGIRDYCETDVLNTYCVYLHFDLMRGIISDLDYDNAIEQLKTYLDSNEQKDHFKEFLRNMK